MKQVFQVMSFQLDKDRLSKDRREIREVEEVGEGSPEVQIKWEKVSTFTFRLASVVLATSLSQLNAWLRASPFGVWLVKVKFTFGTLKST
jgi:hypothetical protein